MHDARKEPQQREHQSGSHKEIDQERGRAHGEEKGRVQCVRACLCVCVDRRRQASCFRRRSEGVAAATLCKRGTHERSGEEEAHVSNEWAKLRGGVGEEGLWITDPRIYMHRGVGGWHPNPPSGEAAVTQAAAAAAPSNSNVRNYAKVFLAVCAVRPGSGVTAGESSRRRPANAPGLWVLVRSFVIRLVWFTLRASNTRSRPQITVLYGFSPAVCPDSLKGHRNLPFVCGPCLPVGATHVSVVTLGLAYLAAWVGLPSVSAIVMSQIPQPVRIVCSMMCGEGG